MLSIFSSSSFGLSNSKILNQPPSLLVPFIHLKFDNNIDNIGTSGAEATGVNIAYSTNRINSLGTHSVQFTGSTTPTNYLYFQNDIPTPNWTGVTIGLWIYPILNGFITSANTHVFNIYSNNDSFLKLFLVQDKSDITKFRLGGNLNNFVNIPHSTWTHLTITGNINKKLNIYINGVISRVSNADEQFLLVPQNFISELKIGWHVAATFNGLVDDWRLYDFEMDATQALALYNNTI
jgi:hypothetical protein